MAKRKAKGPSRPAGLGELIAEVATGEIEEAAFGARKNPAAVALARLGAAKRGRAKAGKAKPRAAGKRAKR